MTQLPVSQFRLDGGTQPRAQLDMLVIHEYAEAMRAGAQFPAVEAVYDGADYWLWDGYHRIEAAKSVWGPVIAVDVNVRQGTRRDAVLASVEANATHGLRRTNADKRRAALVLLRDEEWAQWSDREIARKCMVSNAFVSQLRAEVAPPEPAQDDLRDLFAPETLAEFDAEDAAKRVAVGTPAPAAQAKPAPSVSGKSMAAARKTERAAGRERTVKRNGKTIKMKTANIGKGKKPSKKTATATATAAKALSKAQIAGKVITVERVVTAPVTASAKCPACNVEPLSYDRKGSAWACGDCGAPVILSVSLASEAACSACGKLVNKGAAFCGHCGAILSRKVT